MTDDAEALKEKSWLTILQWLRLGMCEDQESLEALAESLADIANNASCEEMVYVLGSLVMTATDIFKSVGINKEILEDHHVNPLSLHIMSNSHGA